MLTLTAQSQLADAMAQMTRSCALSATRAWTASALRGLALWSEVMATPLARRPDRSDVPAEGQPEGAHDDAGAAFSSYRSGGGHAVAQVIVPR
jgi:hypothetical protein